MANDLPYSQLDPDHPEYEKMLRERIVTRIKKNNGRLLKEQQNRIEMLNRTDSRAYDAMADDLHEIISLRTAVGELDDLGRERRKRR